MVSGSHDSLTFSLDQSGSVSPDTTQQMKDAAKCLGWCVNRIIYNWASVQTLDVTEQLSSGIRYFDIRVATKSDASDQFFCVHSLYGLSVDECLESVATYLGLEEHRREIVILDFNHFYEVSDDAHELLFKKIRESFGSKLCPFNPNDDVSLKFMWDKGYQLIVFYNPEQGDRESNVTIPDFLWPADHIQSPWPNTVDIGQLIDTLETNYKEGRPTEKGNFYVTQGILTPDAKFIITHLCSTIKETLGQTAVGPFLSFLNRDKAIGPQGLNICIMDCVELSGFINDVVGINYLHPTTE